MEYAIKIADLMYPDERLKALHTIDIFCNNSLIYEDSHFRIRNPRVEPLRVVRMCLKSGGFPTITKLKMALGDKVIGRGKCNFYNTLGIERTAYKDRTLRQCYGDGKHVQ